MATHADRPFLRPVQNAEAAMNRTRLRCLLAVSLGLVTAASLVTPSAAASCRVSSAFFARDCRPIERNPTTARAHSGSATRIQFTQPQFWYYCYDPPGYYPYVQQCNGRWRQVPAATAAPKPRAAIPDTTAQRGDNSRPPDTSGAEGQKQGGSQGTDKQATDKDEVGSAPRSAGHVSSGSITQNKNPETSPQLAPNRRADAQDTSESDELALLPGFLFLLALTAAGWLVSKKPSTEVPIIAAMRRWRRRGRLAALIIAVAMLVALLAPGGTYTLAAGVIGAGAILALYGRCTLGQENFSANPQFATAAQQLAQYRAVAHFDHSELFQFRYVRQFEGISAETPFLALHSPSRSLIVTPCRYWSRIGQAYSTASTDSIAVRPFRYEHLTPSPRANDNVVRQTWEHPTKSGAPDLRYKHNRQIFAVTRYGIKLKLSDASEWSLGDMDRANCDAILISFRQAVGYARSQADGSSGAGWSSASGHSNRSKQEEGSGRSSSSPGGGDKRRDGEQAQKNRAGREASCYDILGVAPGASAEEIKAAYREKIKQYHPDLVASLGPKLKEVAERETKALNAAYVEALR